MNKSKYKIIYILLIILIIVSVLYIAKYYYDMLNSKKDSNSINEVQVHENEEISTQNQEIPNINLTNKTERMLKLEELQKENSDIIGWLEIENTSINYPVLQGSDNDFYLRHNYKKEYSINGSIFLDKDYSWSPPGSNLLIYGHNNKNHTMFQELLKYTDISFYEEHPIIKFTTNNEDANFEIIAVFKSKVYYKSEKNVFKYYYFINGKTEDEYNQFVQNVKNASLYDTGKTAKYGEQLITLSTCSYHTTDGRFVVVAKKQA